METRQWIKGAETAGWRLAAVSAVEMRLACARPGCPGSLSVSLHNPGPIPEPCAADHVSGYGVAAFTAYQDLVELLRTRRRALGLAQGDITDAMGMAEGYIAKLESFAKVAPLPTVQLWAQTLGLYITTAPAPLPLATRAAIERRQANPYQPHQARFKHAAG